MEERENGKLVFDKAAYLNRIGYSGETSPSLSFLKALHHDQLHAIPFENFDILLGVPILLQEPVIFDKLVRRRRGGYCFELNGLLLMALNAFGFTARPLLARTHVTGEPSGRGHQVNLVTLDGEDWIVDVGFGGDTPRGILPLETGQEFVHDGQRLRLAADDRFGTMLQGFRDGAWGNLYSFDMSYVCPADIDYGNHYNSTHPSAFFTYARVASLAVPGGGITLFNTTLRHVVGGEVRVRELAEGEGYIEALETHFGIELGRPYEALRPLPPPDFA